jgi:KipI family sensor histidine kinase inhibitor
MRASIREIGRGALLVEFPGVSEDSANRAAVAAAQRLAGRTGLLDAIPGARTLLVVCDGGFDRAALAADLAAVAQPGALSPGRTVRIPVRYGDSWGPDLSDLARGRGISSEEFARRHAAGTYRVAFLGFAPGFGYCVGLAGDLAAPRLPTPRTRVPAGSVAIGASYTGVYPAETPGGWQLIGRSAARFFDPTGDPPTLLLPGDRVLFEPSGEDSESLPQSPDHPITRSPDPDGTPLFRVLNPGLFTSLQGAGRYGRGAFGVPAGGAMDPVALAQGNGLVENPGASVALEITLVGPELEALCDCRAGLAGAPMSAERNGTAVGSGRPFSLRRGDRLRLTRATAGVRAYLCVAGGLAVPPLEWQTRRLSKDDVVFRAEAPLPRTAPIPPGPASADGTVRVALGPQEDRFDEQGIASLFSQPWRVSASSDRRGIRLEGEPISHVGSAEIAPEGTALGSIQVPPDGQPIVLGPDRPVTGGYAKIATVVTDDWPLVAQAGPGALLCFRAASPA